MKINIKFLALASMCSLLVFASCSEMNDLHQDYLDQGEKIYAGKPDSVYVKGGRERAYLELILTQDQRIKEYVIYWNNGADSVRKTVEKTSGTDTVGVMIDNLLEGTYLFNSQTIDGAGNRSLKVETTGYTYGENFQSGLSNRRMERDVWILPGEAMVKFKGNPEKSVSTEFRYTDSEGAPGEFTLSSDDVDAVAQISGKPMKLEMRTLFLPEEGAIDTFYTDWVEVPFIWSAYSGHYTGSGTFDHPSNGAREFSQEKLLQPVDDKTVMANHSDLGQHGYRIKLVVAEDNSVTVTQYNGDGNEIGEMVSDAENSYNPETKTFTLNYRYEGDGGFRVISETIVMK
ncbi:hypothetical protein FUAX_29610 [Fulvitalea axinellae]|uniref:BT-3044-like C-terminal domain-containing protein n=1 Tax=Fulvitalea axinellae TaxID=1182444 RepID=A0AAU9CEE2_9BACT|nr:hypothetical protein FUAX_29610 [Fulvitalea axinellae]